MMVYAVCDINKGEEVTLTYHDPWDQYNKRDEHFQGSYGFKCDCRLCVFESQHQQLIARIADFKSSEVNRDMVYLNPNQLIAKATNILKEVGLIL